MRKSTRRTIEELIATLKEIESGRLLEERKRQVEARLRKLQYLEKERGRSATLKMAFRYCFCHFERDAPKYVERF